MIPVTDEDRLKLRVYGQLENSFSQLSPTEFALLVRQTYEKEKYAKHWFASPGTNGLEQELLSFAYTHLNTPENKRREVDAKALKTIKKRNRCKGTDPIAVGYFRVYQAMIKGLVDLQNGIAYIEDQVESEGVEGLEEFGDNSLEGQLTKLALKSREISQSKKRKVDYQALALIKRCSSCKNSPALIRHYYGFYKNQLREN